MLDRGELIFLHMIVHLKWRTFVNDFSELNDVWFMKPIWNILNKKCSIFINISVTNGHYQVKKLNINEKGDVFLKKIKFFTLRIPMK